MPAQKWDSGLVSRTLRAYHRQGRDLSYNAMARRHQGLVSASNYYHGSYRKAIEAAGLDYSAIRRKPHWTRKLVVQALQDAHRKGKDLSWSAVSRKATPLRCAAKAALRLYGDWNKALRAAGLDPVEITSYQHWDAKTVVHVIRRRHRKGEPVNPGGIQRDLPGLYRAAVRHFGSFTESLRQAGLRPERVLQRREWDRKLVGEELRDFYRQHRAVTPGLLRVHDTGLFRAVRLHFPNLQAALAAARVNGYANQRG